MFRKNVSGQYLYFVLVNATTGAPLTGATVTGQRSIDGGTQAAVTGTITEDTAVAAKGMYHLALSTADINGNNIGFNFTATNAVPVGICVVTTAADPTDAVRFGLSALPSGPMAVKKNQTLTAFEFPMYDTAGSLTTGLTVTAARSIDGAAFGACANSVTEIGSGFYAITLAAADLNGTVITLLFTAAGCPSTAVTLVTQA